MRKKRLKRKLRALAERHEQLEQAHRRLAAHTEVIALAVRSRDHVPPADLDDAIAGIHELNAVLADSSAGNGAALHAGRGALGSSPFDPAADRSSG